MKQYVGMVIHAANGNGRHFFVLADSRHVGPEFWLNIFGNHSNTVFCAEDYMKVIFNKCMRHSMSPLRGLYSIFDLLPTAHAVGSIISPLRG